LIPCSAPCSTCKDPAGCALQGWCDAEAPPRHRFVSERLYDIARKINRLPPPDRRDPEKYWRDKSEIAAELRKVAREAV
jgi:hypothetical protein